MAVLDRVQSFGAHSVTMYNRETGLPYGLPIRILGDVTRNDTVNNVFNTGGSFPGATGVELSGREISVAITLREVPVWAYSLAGYDVSSVLDSSVGTVQALAALKGTSVIATTGLSATPTITTEGDVKEGAYVIKVASATTVNVYAYTDIEFNSVGTKLKYYDNEGRITATPLTIVTGATVAIPGTGLSLTGGSGTIAMTIGDTALLKSSRSYKAIHTATLRSTASPKFFGMITTSQRDSSGNYTVSEYYKCNLPMLPSSNKEKGFSEISFNVGVILDDVKNDFFTDTIRQ